MSGTFYGSTNETRDAVFGSGWYNNYIFQDADDLMKSNRVEISKNLLRKHNVIINDLDDIQRQEQINGLPKTRRRRRRKRRPAGSKL